LYEHAFDNRILNGEKPFPTSRLAWLGEEIHAPQKREFLRFNNLRTRWKASREIWTKSLPVLQESATDQSLKATLYQDVASKLSMAEMSQRIDDLTMQMTKFTAQNIRQVGLLKEESNRVVKELTDENNRLRQMIRTFHDSFMRPGATPYPATCSFLPTGCPASPGLDTTDPNQAMHSAFRHRTHQHPQPASPLSPATLPTSPPVPPLPHPQGRPILGCVS